MAKAMLPQLLSESKKIFFFITPKDSKINTIYFSLLVFLFMNLLTRYNPKPILGEEVHCGNCLFFFGLAL